MTSRQALHEYLEAHKGEPVETRVYFFHAHIYYDHTDPGEAALMAALKSKLQAHFEHDDDVEIHTLMVRPAN